MAAVLLLVLSGCAGTAHKSVPQLTSEEKQPVHAELDSQTLYYLLVGELSGHQGDMDTALQYYIPAAKNNDDPRIAARAARIAIYAKDNERGIVAAKRWLQLEPESNEARQAVIVILLRQQKTEAASQHILALIKAIRAEENSSDKQVFAAVAKLLQSEAEPADTTAVFKILSKYYSNSEQVYLWLSRFAMQANMYDEALPAISRVIELDPANDKAYVLKARLLALSGQMKEALAVMLIAVNKQPDDFALRKQFASMLIRENQLQQAQDQFEILYKMRPNDRETLISLGVLLMEKQQFGRAQQLFEELGTNPQNSNESKYYLARIDETQQRYADALEKYSQVQISKIYFDARLRMANISSFLGDLKAAEDILQALLLQQDDQANRARIYLVHGHILQNTGDTAGAMKVYSQALAEIPTNVDLLYAHALAAESLDMVESAVAGLKTLLTHEPDNVQALNALGYTLADRTDRYEEALEYILLAYKLNSNDAAIMDSLGWVYFRLGNYTESLKYLQKAFNENKDPEIAAHLGEVLWVTGKQDEARQVWQQGKQTDDKHRILLETIKRLDQ